MFSDLPASFLQMSAIFLSIFIEALPFVLLGSIISGFIEVYLTPEKVVATLPKNRFWNILIGSFAGLVFPSCECGIVPVIHRFLKKKVPTYTAIPFLMTAPVINPIVLFATFSAFGNSWLFALTRALGSLILAQALGLLLGFVWTEDILISHQDLPLHGHRHTHQHQGRFFQAWVHAIDEFFDSGRYLILGALFASCVQVYVPTRILTGISSNPLVAILILMLLSFLLSLCSEADAFIGSSFLGTFGMAPVMAFLVIGPVLDIKNLLMMTRVFKKSFIRNFILITVTLVFLFAASLEVFL